MIGWLSGGRLENEIWKDVSKTYWEYNGSDVMQTVKEWALQNPQLLNGAKAKGKKPKKRSHAHAPTTVDLPADNLVEKLSLLLNLGTTLDHEPVAPEEALTISSTSKGTPAGKSKESKATTSKGKGKRKASELSDEDDDLDSDESEFDEFGFGVPFDFPEPEPEPPAGGSSRKKRATTASKGKGKGKAKAKQATEDEELDPKVF